MSRDLPLFGVVMISRVTERLTECCPWTRSTSSQRSAINSPCRIPVRSATRIIVLHSTSAAPTKSRVGLLEGQEVEVGTRHLEPLDLGDGIDEAALLRHDEETTEHGQVVVHALGFDSFIVFRAA